MRIGINGSGLLAHPDLDDLVADVAGAESAGFAGYWLAQTGLIDPLTCFAATRGAASAIELGTAVVPTWPRHPQAVAAQALTTQAAVGGRLVLGIGLAHRPSVEGRWKLAWTRPIRHMLDYLDVLLPLLESGSVHHEGEIWSFEGEAARITDQPPSVMLAALGDQMLRIAGRRTDGTILWCVGPKTLDRQIVPGITAAADEAGRPAPRVVCSLPVWVTDRPDEARAALARALTVYGELPSYRAMLDIEGVDGPADISLVGSADDVREGLAEVAAAGATDFSAVVQGFDPDERAAGRELLAEAV